MFYILFRVAKYWHADALYASAKGLNRNDNPQKAQEAIVKAIDISPNEPLYRLELAESYTKMAIAQKDIELIKKAIEESEAAYSLSPANVNTRRAQFSLYIRLAALDQQFLLGAVKVLEEAILFAPTDAKLFYNLGLTYARLGQIDKAVEIMEKTVSLKQNYKEARLAYAFLLIDKKEVEKAKEELIYILAYIDPNDAMARQQLSELK